MPCCQCKWKVDTGEAWERGYFSSTSKWSHAPEYCATAYAQNNVWSEASRNDVGSGDKLAVTRTFLGVAS